MGEYVQKLEVQIKVTTNKSDYGDVLTPAAGESGDDFKQRVIDRIEEMAKADY